MSFTGITPEEIVKVSTNYYEKQEKDSSKQKNLRVRPFYHHFSTVFFFCCVYALYFVMIIALCSNRLLEAVEVKPKEEVLEKV